MTKLEKHKEICKELNSIYETKNNDYGDSFSKTFTEYGLTMPCILLEDKLNRLKALNKNKEHKVKDESIKDTLMDLANYAIMTLIEFDEKNSKLCTPTLNDLQDLTSVELTNHLNGIR